MRRLFYFEIKTAGTQAVPAVFGERALVVCARRDAFYI
jgi:hypothetical protein